MSLKWSEEGGVFRVWFDGRTLVIWMAVLAILCGVIAAAIATDYFIPSSGGIWMAEAICLTTGFGLLIMAAFKAKRERAQGDYLRYDMASDTLVLPRARRVISDAKSCMVFSLERYTISSTENEWATELNVVQDGCRERFLSILSSGGDVKKLAAELEMLGFCVDRFDDGGC